MFSLHYRNSYDGNKTPRNFINFCYLSRASIALLSGILLASCGKSDKAQSSDNSAPVQETSVSVVDGNGDTVTLVRPAKRVISLLASGTESLIAIGAIDNIVGRTIYDKDPAVKHIPLVGTGLEPNLETLLALKPDLIIGWTAEKRQKLHDRITGAGIKVYNLATQDTSDIFKGIRDLSHLVGRDSSGDVLLNDIRSSLDSIRKRTAESYRPRVLYIVSIEPPITSSLKTYVGQLIGVAGGDIIFPRTAQNWPIVSLEEIAVRDPEYIILPIGEFKRNAIERLKVLPGWKNLKAVRENRVIAIDADLINRPGANIGRLTQVLADSLQAIPDSVKRIPVSGR